MKDMEGNSLNRNSAAGEFKCWTRVDTKEVGGEKGKGHEIRRIIFAQSAAAARLQFRKIKILL